MYKPILFAYISASLHLLVLSCSIPTFKNTTVWFYKEKYDPFWNQNQTEENTIVKETISGCISSKEFYKIESVNEEIDVLQKDSIANINMLQEIHFSKNNLQVILPGFIENVPNLTKIEIKQNDITTLLEDTFSGLGITEIKLDNNKISVIQGSAFKNLKRLDIVSLKYNQITTWNPAYFSKCRELRNLNLDGNLIETLPSNAFKDFPRLSILYLRNNLLKNLPSDAFTGIKYFFTLDLADNHLKELNENLFSSLNARNTPKQEIYISSVFTGILNLHIHNNNLTYLPDKLLKDINYFVGSSMLTMHSNPWQCACFDKILNLARKQRVSIDRAWKGCVDKRNPVCVVPKENSSVCQEKNENYFYEDFYREFTPAVHNIFDRNIDCN